MRFEDNEEQSYLMAQIRFHEAGKRPMRDISRVEVKVFRKPFIVPCNPKGILAHLGDGLYEYVAGVGEGTDVIIEFNGEGTEEKEVLAELKVIMQPIWDDLKELNKAAEMADYASETYSKNGFPKRKYELGEFN